MRKLLSLFSVLCALASVSATATELTDLGQGLSYLRVHSLGDSEKALRSAVPGAGALVLDLRHATTSDDEVEALKVALADHPASTPLLILVSPATPSVIVTAITLSSALTLGAPGSAPAPNVVVQTDVAADRRAYDALETGTPLATLISGKVEKDRFDEATLVKEFKNGNPDAEPPPLPDPTAPKSAAAPEKLVPLNDRVLQRAVHLHRAVLALKAR